ncbi:MULTISPECIES: DUF4878 domain-containing protein [Comamonas]|jgi:hypothetical protein|uniref:DUF4878 domain-containing protein n=1 Tax=Comamonas avium TaxID=2762231 RepID=A0ABR8S850_9BURK|nr:MULTISPECIES: DUF4878 domain-containing protein [Comamonas]MBD7959649.1 DUF4878 domain-containing protein [Comamonas avium]MBD9403114.1 DUF4878 domain-containing protein [Comamonas sp. CMM02]
MNISRRTWLAMGMSLGLTACLGGSAPIDVIRDFYMAVAAGNADKATQYLALQQVSADEMRLVKAKVEMMVAQGKSVVDANNGLAKIDMLQEDMAADGNSAKVKVQVTFKNDKTKNESFTLLKEDGHWKIRL